MNNKGFSLIELLGVITIIGILSGLAMAAYSRYQDRSVRQAYQMMSKNVASAAEDYFMEHRGAVTVSVETLVEDEYLEPTIDPASKEGQCGGEVSMETEDAIEDGALSSKKFKVELDCPGTAHDSCKIYPGGEECD